MRILVVGAGAVGGYFGGRLLHAGRDVTFLVRPARQELLARQGLLIKSPHGDVTCSAPPTILADELREPFDAILLSCKAYDLDSAMDSFAPAVGDRTLIVPLLNGMQHLDRLDARFGQEHVLGGVCLISARLDEAGKIHHLNDVHQISFGARQPEQKDRVDKLAQATAGAGFDAVPSENIILEMWEKWVFLATLAGMTCLTRASVGDIVAVGGVDLTESLLEECRGIAKASGWIVRPEFMARAHAVLTANGSPMMASMLGDLERGGPTEAEHILGDLLRRRGTSEGTGQSLLRLAHVATSAYAHRLGRQHVIAK